MAYATNYRKTELRSSESFDSPYYVREREINNAVGELHESRWGDYNAHKNLWHEILGLSLSEYKKLSHLRKDALRAEYWFNLRQEVLDSRSAVQEIQPQPTDAVLGNQSNPVKASIQWKLIHAEIFQTYIDPECGEMAESEMVKMIVGIADLPMMRRFIQNRLAQKFPDSKLSQWWQPYEVSADDF